MIERFQRQMTRLVGCPHGCRYLLAVSGGADSMVLATLFLLSGYDFEIAHCNFHLRGADSDRDMHFVQRWAADHQIPCQVKEFDTMAIQQDSGKSVEMTARDLRYQWFSQISTPFDYIVTAHHANDDAETILLNLTRGTGLQGLTGIPERNGVILRPLLTFSAEEIRTFAGLQQIAYMTDITNADEEIKRNRIRHTVIPALQQLNPNLVHTIARNKQVLQQQSALYHYAVADFTRRALSEKEGAIHIQRSEIDGFPFSDVLLYEILRPYQFSESDVKDMLMTDQPGKLFRAPNHLLVVDRDAFIVRPLPPQPSEARHYQNLEELLEDFSVTRHTAADGIQKPADGNTFIIPEHKLTFPITLRHWQPGDYFFPFGGKGKRKLSDFFTDRKVNRLDKDQVPLFCIGDDIAWVVGYRSDERFRVEESDTHYYCISLFKHNS